MQNYIQAPLPFQGQKKRFYLAFKQALSEFQNKAIFIDLFGGSGFLSNVVKQTLPHARVIYNDFDDYSVRLANVEHTNAILTDIRGMLNGHGRKKITDEQRTRILERIAKEPDYVDYITLSYNFLFSMHYVLSFSELTKETMYNNVRKSNYSLCDDYLQGVEVVKTDYKELYRRYRDQPGVVFLVDPPYLSTDIHSYNKESYWKLSDYLDVLPVIQNSSYFYFTSDKSEIIELCDWMEKNIGGDNPFREAVVKKVGTAPTHNSGYTDIMLYRRLD